MPTKQDIEDLSHFIASVVENLRLRDWTIKIEPDVTICPNDAHAIVSIGDGRKQATICFGTTFWESNGSCRTHTVIHELLHCHTHGINLAIHDMESRLGTDNFNNLETSTTRAMEYCVDGIADAFVQMFPDFLTTAEIKAAKKEKTKPVKAKKKR
jgi:hypothetical protein